eukprot:TRINITY_DN3639_c0_g1_i3.p1 TRINITY_DN3639_c0_g1~~TRINITY_DN3639_c0_g1_i3.p1  ORF type:complete len:176 (-),score=27.82 TRINITY_DN3639_c0_g1_i3:61-588(-)
MMKDSGSKVDSKFIYVLEDEVFAQEKATSIASSEHWLLQFGDRNFIDQNKGRRFNREKMTVTLQAMGFKAVLTHKVIEKIFNVLNEQANQLVQSTKLPEGSEKPNAMTSKSHFMALIQDVLADLDYNKAKNPQFDFEIACEIVEQKKSLVILLGGTSGTGKSTLCSLLGLSLIHI